jgi:hypothetical protein
MIGPYEPDSIHCGDALDLCQAVPDESIDVIFSDPPYDRESIWLYDFLAVMGGRVLKPGGFLCTMTGGYYLDQVMRTMSMHSLSWYWDIQVLVMGAAPMIWPRHIIARTKPILMWTKGKGCIEGWNMTSLYQGQGPDKRYHAWGQDVGSARYVLSYIFGDLAAGKVVLDPLCGGGTTLVAAKIVGADYLGFDIDPVAVKTSQQRLTEFDLDDPQQLKQLPIFGGSNECLE